MSDLSLRDEIKALRDLLKSVKEWNAKFNLAFLCEDSWDDALIDALHKCENKLRN